MVDAVQDEGARGEVGDVESRCDRPAVGCFRQCGEGQAAFSVCLGTAPDSAACFYNRALAYAASGHSEEARRDVERALQLDPAHEQAKWLLQAASLNTENTEKMNR